LTSLADAHRQMGISTLAVGRFCCWRRFEDGASSARFMPQKAIPDSARFGLPPGARPLFKLSEVFSIPCREGYSRPFLNTPLAGARSVSCFREAFILRDERQSPFTLESPLFT
jgi:hypothetical protein